jgi:O-antigen biosynthesis protein
VKTYDIVIPHMNNPRVNVMAVSCLRSIRNNSQDYRVIWIQNGGPVPGSIVNALRRCEEVKIIQNATNLGFVKATNQGIRESNAPFVVLMNNDTEAAPGWLRKLQRPLLEGSAISGPLSSASGSWQGTWQPRVGDPVEVPANKSLAFFCTMITRQVFEQIGCLDESFGLGLGDDDEYCQRAREAGYRLALVQDLSIVHRHRSTFRTLFTRSQIHEIQQAAVKKLRAKGCQI